MKYVQQRIELLLTLGPIFILAGIALVAYAEPQIIAAFKLNWIFLFVLLIIVISPWGRLRLCAATSQEKPQYSFFAWLKRIIFLQICLLLVFFGITVLCTQLLPTYFNLQSHEAILANTLFDFNWRLGFFPWPLYAIIAGAIAVVAHHNKKDAFISTLTHPITRSTSSQTIGTFIDFDSRFATLGALTATIGAMSLITAYLFSSLSNPFSNGFNKATVIIIFLLLIFSFTKPFTNLTKKIFIRKFSFAWSLLLITIALGALLAILYWAFQGFKQSTLNIPNPVLFMMKKDWHGLWLVFALSWWTAWVPVVGAYLAKISRGMSLRTMLSGILIFPIIFALVIWVMDYYSLFNSLHFHPIILAILSLFGFLGFMFIITEKTMLAALIQSYLPREGRYKPRGHQRFFSKIIQVSVVFIYVYLPTGIACGSTLLFLMAYPMAIVSLIILVAFLKMLVQPNSFN